nr:TspO/MBR family protein [Clostridium estertheticum]
MRYCFLELLLLLVFILLTTFEFYKIDKTAAYLMIPYIAWVSFAGVLNYTIWMLN